MWSFGIRCASLTLLVAPLHADCCKSSVAVVARLSGTALVHNAAGANDVAVSAMDWLSEGATIVLGARSEALLIFSNGHRFELGDGAKVTLTADGVPKTAHGVRELDALPPIPRPAPIEVKSAPTSGAVRVRGAAEVTSLYPRSGTLALPDKVTLRFRAVPEATSYRVSLENDLGDNRLDLTTEATEVAVPTGTIDAGETYRWRVRAMRSGVTIAMGMAEFRTLSAEGVLQREEFASALNAGKDDPANLALLANVDLQLGLVAEACDELSTALKQRPDDPALQRTLLTARSNMTGETK